MSDGLDLFGALGVIDPGDVVSLASDPPGSVTRSAGPADALVVGCAQRIDAGSVAVASSRVALCRVDASLGAIAVGDLLVASPDRGTAMKADSGAVVTKFLGRAIDALPAGSGLIRVLLGAR
jgi:hypothetical protein